VYRAWRIAKFPEPIFKVRACLPKPWHRQGRPPGMGHFGYIINFVRYPKMQSLSQNTPYLPYLFLDGQDDICDLSLN
jgi:hypothetical protein